MKIGKSKYLFVGQEAARKIFERKLIREKSWEIPEYREIMWDKSIPTTQRIIGAKWFIDAVLSDGSDVGWLSDKEYFELTKAELESVIRLSTNKRLISAIQELISAVYQSIIDL